MTPQQQWNRYVDAINFCIRLGYYILPVMSKGSSNCKGIWVRTDASPKEVYIPLKPKKYKSMELLRMIEERL